MCLSMINLMIYWNVKNSLNLSNNYSRKIK